MAGAASRLQSTSCRYARDLSKRSHYDGLKKGSKGSGSRPPWELIRDLSYDTEDCFEEFLVMIKHRSMLQQCLSLGARHRIAMQIRTIKQRIQGLNQRRERYKLIQHRHTISDDVKGDFQVTRNFAALFTEEAQLVGFERPKSELLNMISRRTDGRNVVSVVGMGGLGKTTLAKKVYDSNELHSRFVKRAWITVSQSFSHIELLKNVIKQLLGAEYMKKLEEKYSGMTLQVQVQHFTEHLRDQLNRRRYFVVLDDLWTIEAWNSIQYAFPDHSSENCCVVVTTRNIDVAKVCSSHYPDHIYHLKHLEKEHAKELLLKKIHQTKDPQVFSQKKGPEEDKLVDEILKKCGGLPLAIVTIGGLLANKGINEWKSLRDQLPEELASSNPSVEALRQVVTLSYNHLPSHLKPCFLYPSLFPEDFEIKRKHLVNRWIAEGFVVRIGTARRTLEGVAESYFYELISRSLIQPSKLGILGNVKSCRVHDIVHDIAVSISREENHVFLVDEHTSTTSATEQTIRHLSFFAEKNLNKGLVLSGVRSITVFNKIQLAPFHLSRFKMLRVLDLKYAASIRSRKQDINIGSLIHLKYLHFPSFERHDYTLPRSIGDLKSLQTLDIGYSRLANLPTEITKLQNLRNLRCTNSDEIFCFDIHDYIECMTTVTTPICFTNSGEAACCFCFVTDSDGVRVPKGVGRLQELQVLEKVDIRRSSDKAIKELGELAQLKKLVVQAEEGTPKRKCKILSMALGNLSSLRSFSVNASGLVDSWPNILSGHLGKLPSWVGESVNLVKIKLICCRIKEVDALAELPNLILLHLGYEAYSAEQLVFHRHAFPKLRTFRLEDLKRLREVAYEEGTSARLESICIRACKLTLRLTGIKHLTNLREVSIGRCILANADMLREEVDAHHNHPVLQMDRLSIFVPVEDSLSELGENSQS
ncbi:hypothetical protein EJB05_45224 [Eragrostis curvula]|uniref:Uncharacterized protein n=1 Tax=Eragrostis curvula TaxID=38414 RepID=A0A5J9TJR8_9POAL|nr:hypothetical protein EJB05_45224 [Eragrostis curvula]